MAAGNATLYSAAAFAFGQAVFNLASDNFQAILLTNSYVPNANVDSLYSDISINEVVAGGGYSTGGLLLTGQTWLRSGGTSTFSGQSVIWAGSTLAARYVALVRRAGLSLVAGDRLLCYADLTGTGNASTTAAPFQVNWNNASTSSFASTIFTQTHNP